MVGRAQWPCDFVLYRAEVSCWVSGRAGGQEDLGWEAAHRDLGGCPQQILRSDVWDSASQTSISARKLPHSPPP